MLPITLCVHGRRQEITKRTGSKAEQPQVLKVRQLSGRVDATWMDLEHGRKEYFHPYGARVVQYAKNAFNYLHVHGGDLLREVRSMLAKVQKKVLADFPSALYKTNGLRIATSAECAAYNLLVNLPEDVVPVDRLKESREGHRRVQRLPGSWA